MDIKNVITGDSFNFSVPASTYITQFLAGVPPPCRTCVHAFACVPTLVCTRAWRPQVRVGIVLAHPPSLLIEARSPQSNPDLTLIWLVLQASLVWDSPPAVAEILGESPPRPHVFMGSGESDLWPYAF